MEIYLELENQSETRPLTFRFDRMVNAGYVGKNQEEVQRHIQELAAKGISGPKSTPVLFPVICNTLTTDGVIEVYGDKTSGEVEYVLLVKDENEVYVGLGSDHTDRHLEETDIPRAKQICPNIMSRRVWPLKEVSAHWDDLLMTSRIVNGDEETTCQEGRLGLLLNPEELMTFVKTKLSGPLKDLVIFSGTMGTLTGEFAIGQRFSASLIDEKLNRRLDIAYGVRPLDYLTVE